MSVAGVLHTPGYIVNKKQTGQLRLRTLESSAAEASDSSAVKGLWDGGERF
jgi:hypothetical protein